MISYLRSSLEFERRKVILCKKFSACPKSSSRNSKTIVRSDVLVGVLLVLVMLVGGYFRFTGINWDDFTHLHPDERFLTDVAQGLGQQLNPSGDAAQRQAQVAECLRRYPDSGGQGPYFDSLLLGAEPAQRQFGARGCTSTARCRCSSSKRRATLMVAGVGVGCPQHPCSQRPQLC